MISYFPTPYPDEIFYSLLARFGKHTSMVGPKEVLEALFGTTTVSATLDLPSHLACFQARTVRIFKKSVEDIITDHTLLPFYAPYIPVENLEKVKASMAGKSGNIHTRVGLNAGLFAPVATPRYCPVCFEADRSKYGEAYWHRSHQVPSFQHCPAHHCQLYGVGLQRYLYNKHYFIPADDMHCCDKWVIPNENVQVNPIIERALASLYGASDSRIAPYHYRKLLVKAGFAKGTNNVDQVALAEAFTSFYSLDTLVYFKSEVDYISSNCWLKAISRKARKTTDPIRHALLNNFLQHYTACGATNGFGNGPWPCLNPACPHFNTTVITQVNVIYDRKSRRHIGHLKCSCGFIYSQSFIAKQNKTFIRVQRYGPLWEARLQHLTKQGLPTRRIANALHCDSKTVTSQLRKMHCSPGDAAKDLKQEQQAKRSQWLAIVEANPDNSISELKAGSSALYAWLYRNDKEWLKTIRYRHDKNKPKQPRLSWEERDQQYLKLLKAAHEAIIAFEKPKRVSKTLLFTLTHRRSTLEKNLSSLPLTKFFIDSIAESDEDFRIRRIHTYKHSCIEAGEELKRWKLLRLAGVRKSYINEQIEATITDILAESFSCYEKP